MQPHLRWMRSALVLGYWNGRKSLRIITMPPPPDSTFLRPGTAALHSPAGAPISESALSVTSFIAQNRRSALQPFAVHWGAFVHLGRTN